MLPGPGRMPVMPYCTSAADSAVSALKGTVAVTCGGSSQQEGGVHGTACRNRAAPCVLVSTTQQLCKLSLTFT
jgi:hypothetical protein